MTEDVADLRRLLRDVALAVQDLTEVVDLVNERLDGLATALHNDMSVSGDTRRAAALARDVPRGER